MRSNGLRNDSIIMIDESLRPAVRLKPFLRILPILTFDSAKYDAQKI